MWRVQTGGRLHLGLLSLPTAEERWPDRLGQPSLPTRRFGGIGLMIDEPALSLRIEPAANWFIEGPHTSRVRQFVQRLADLRVNAPPRRVIVEQAPREHVGLGLGTQLGLAVARGLTASWGLSLSTAQLAALVGRGQRSALGVHGFEQGGFLVDAGKSSAEKLAPLVARLEFPSSWRVLFLIPSPQPGQHGLSERLAFQALTAPQAATESLCRIVLLGILPALVEQDFRTFSEAVFDFNVRVGELFAPVQGGIYSAAAVTELIHWLRSYGIRGVGQSSWGPGVFAFCESQAEAVEIRAGLREQFPALELYLARGRNVGHFLTTVEAF